MAFMGGETSGYSCPFTFGQSQGGNGFENIPFAESIPNWIAMAQAMFGPEYPKHNTENHSTSHQQSRSSVTIDKHKYQANFDVQHFKPEEITVKVTGEHTITIEAKHEEKQDEHGKIFRHFIRTYELPENCDMARLESKLSSDGVLTITAPTIGEHDAGERTIPITRTGEPAKLNEEKRSEKAANEN